MIVNSTLLQSALNQLSNFVSKNSSRPALTGIHVVYEDGTLTLEATDSFCLAQFKMAAEPRDYDENTDVIIKPVKYKADRFDFAELNLKDMFIRNGDGTKIALNAVSDCEYPSLSRCVPEGSVKETFSIEVDKLTRAIKGLPKDAVVNIEYRNEVKPIVITTKSNESFSEHRIVVSLCRTYK